jgi:hypothetical protein
MIVEKVDQGVFRFRLGQAELMLGPKEFFAEIKDAIPGQCRRYDENARVWTVDEIYLPLVIQKLQYHFPTNPPTDVVLSEVGTLSRFFVKKKKPTRRFALGGVQTARKRMVA